MRLLLTYVLLLVPLIGLSQPPTAQFVSGNFVACAGEPVNFTDLSVANGSPIVGWSWDFGDGNASNAVNPSHSYSAAGNYTIILVVSAANGQADSEVKFAYITINPKPIPDFSSTANGCALPVGVTYTNITIGGQSYEWDFGNGQTSTLENPAMVTYAVAGNYSVTLISTNSFGCKDTITQNIVISDFQAGITAPTTACEGAPINITDNSTVGANVWNWTFIGGNPAGSTNQNEVVTYPSPGVYTIQLTAQNTVAGCSDNTNQSITILPTPTPTFTGTPTSGCAPQAVNFTNTTGSPGTYIWDFGDGSSFNGTTPPSHTYSTDGSYSVGLTFTDANGCIGSTLLNNYINLNSPIASFAAPVLDGCAPLSVQLASTSVSAIDPIIDWQWDFGDGTLFNGEVPPSHDYAVGTYAVTLTITTQGGCVATVTIPNYIQVGQIDLVDFSWNPPISCANVPIDFVDESIISVPHDPSEVIYSWDFGDGGTSTLEDPSYPYSADTGYFDVQLVVEFRGCLDTLIEPNAVYILAPISIFQPSQSLFCNPASFPITVTVNDNSIIGILSDDADMTWNWGDGTSTNYDDPDFDDPDQGTTSHDYAAYGSYTITQIINNYTTGCVDSSNTVINISQIIAGLSIDVDSLCLGFPVTVTSSSTSTHPFGTFDWNMGNGEFLNGDNLPYVYGASGNYSITLTATNVLGCSDTEILTPVTVLQPPTAGISANDYMGCAPFLVTFSNNSMVQGNGVPLDSFQFTFFDDGSIVNTNNVLTTVDHTFNSSGAFAVEIIATDQFGCVSPPSSAIISVTKPFADFNVQNVVCNNESFTANNNSIGLEPMTYQWFVDGTQVSTNTNYSSSFNEPFDPLSSSASHDLMLITTDANGCKDTMQQTIVVSTPVAALSYLLDGAATNANGDFVCPPVFADFTDQTLSYGSISTWSWTFGDGKTSNLQSPSNTYVFPGTYSASLSITDEFGCTSDTVLIDFLTIFGPTASPTWSDFVNACGLNVSLDIGVTQNVTSNVWNLDDGAIVNDQNSVTHIYSVPGTYEPFVTVYDANNCQVIYPLGPFTLTQPQLSINALGDVILCHGSADGNITGTVTGGAAPYVVTLNQTGTTQAVAIDGGSFDFGGLSGASSGGFASYTVTVTDASGSLCSVTSTVVTITEPSLPASVVLDAQQDIICFGNATGSINVTASGGTAPYSYSWTGPNGFISSLEDLSGLVAGTYSLQVVDANGLTGGCTSSLSVTLTQPTSGLAVSLDNQQNVDCFGNASGSINVTASGGTQPYTYSWTGPNGFSSTLDDISLLEAGNYSLTVSDANTGAGNCNAMLDATILEPTQLNATINGDAIVCFGDEDGNIIGTVTGGVAPYTVTLDQNGATQVVGSDGGGFDFNGLNGVPNGGFPVYSVSITDANNCSQASSSVSISEPSTPLSVVLNSQVDILCFGNSTGSISVTASGGTAPYSYSWTGPNGYTSNTEDPVGLFAGAYNLTVTDANGSTGGCLASLTVSLVEPANPVVAVLDGQQNVLCFGNSDGAITTSVSGGTAPYTYSWSGPGGFVSNNEDVSGLIAGNYSLIVTDANGAVGSCASSLNVTIQQPTPLTITTSVTTDYNGYGVSCYQLSDAAILAVVGGGVQFPGGVYSYSWTADPATPSAIVPVGQEGLMNPNGLTAGNYLVTVTDNNGCTINDQILVTEPSELQISSLVPSLYPNGLNISGCSPDGFADVSAVGGVPAYTFDWSNDGVGDFNDPTQVINLAGGWLYVVAQDLNGCQVGDSVFMTFDFNLVTASAQSFVFPSGDNISCFNFSDGSIDLTVNGGTTPYAYSWVADPATPTATIPAGQEIVQDPNGVTAGNYIVTITDQTGCTVTTSINLSQPSNLLVSAVVPDLGGYNVAGCLQNGSIDLTVSGGSPGYSILWSNSETTEDIDSLAAGPYSVEISDINGCQFILDTVLIESEPLTAVTVVTTDYNGADISCFNASDGGIMATISGGAPAYIIQWFDSLENFLGDQAALNGLPEGDYTIIVQDQYGCLDTSVVNLQEPTLVQYDISVLSNYNGWDISCFGAADGMIDFFITGGTPGYTFQWSDSNAVVVSNIEDPTGLVAGLYFVSAADLNGCPADTSIILDQPTPLTGQITITSDYNGQNVSCFGASDGSLNGFAEGGVPDYSYTWTDQSGNIVGNGQDVNDIPGGEYYMVATDLNGCVFIDSILVQEPPALTVSPTIVSFYFGAAVSCDYASDGIVDANASGGLPGYTYSWNTNPAQNASLATGLSAGTYTVTVTDLNGCTSTNTIVLNANPSPQPVLPEPGVGCIGSNILINAVQGGWQYCSWTFSDGQNFTECAPFVTSFDSVGCYSLQLTVLNDAGCMGSAFSSNFICVEPNPVASFYADNYEISNVEPGVVFINTSTGADSYYWYYSDVSYYDSTINVYHEFSGGDEFGVTDYTVILYAVSQYGCIDSTSRRITMLPELIVYVPNAFTPDGDIYNNTFFPVISGGYTTEDYSFLIFNRWGELIYESSEMGEGWDGSYRGKKCQDGVYTWKLNVRKSYTDEIKEYVGHVSLLRGGRP
jgi:gliding motility-associated-like protein